MDQKKLSWWFRVIIISVGLIGAVVYFFIFPFCGKSIADTYPEYAYAFWPWLIFLWVTGIPCYIALAYGWNIATSIGEDQSFSLANANRLKKISYLVAGDTKFFAVGNIVLLVLNINHIGILLISVLIMFVGFAIAIVAAALSHLVMKAANLQEQSDLTI